MKKHLLTLTCTLSLSLAACQSTDVKSDSGEAAPTQTEKPWNAKMHELAVHLQSLIKPIYSEKVFMDPDNHEEIRKNLIDFSKAVKGFSSHPMSKYPDRDPSLSITMDRLRGDVERAKESFIAKDYGYARSNLKSVTQYCFYCHTRRSEGLKIGLQFDQIELTGATSIEKSDYFVATRQFDKARNTLRGVLHEKQGPFSFTKEKALRKLLLIELRSSVHPDAALEAIKEYSKNSQAPAYMVQLTSVWKKDLEEWKRKNGAIPNDLKSIQKLIKKAEKRKKFVFDDVSNVLYLIASRGLHDLLAKKISKVERAKAYYLLAQSYEVLRESGLWNLNEIYYESCIRTLQHSPLAYKCYKRLEDSIIVGYSGSGGFFMPYSVRQHLKELYDLAKPMKKNSI